MSERAESLDPFFELPHLKAVNGTPRGWNRDIHELPYLHDLPQDDPRQLEYGRLVLAL